MSMKCALHAYGLINVDSTMPHVMKCLKLKQLSVYNIFISTVLVQILQLSCMCTIFHSNVDTPSVNFCICPNEKTILQNLCVTLITNDFNFSTMIVFRLSNNLHSSVFIGGSLSEPHTNHCYEKIAVLVYVCTYVFM